MPATVFFSWQSDRPAKTNRNFIEEALKGAIKDVNQSLNLEKAQREDELQLDKDTKDVPGAPPILETILNKISTCSAFVPDLTFVGKTDEGRLLQNPNVLIEYGWALNSVGHSRMLAVMNTAFGEPSEQNLPFDMRHFRHPITYHLNGNEGPQERDAVRNKLRKELTNGLKVILEKAPRPTQPQFQGQPDTTNPSTFLKTGESFTIEAHTQSGMRTLHLPPGQRLFMRIIPRTPLDTITSEIDAWSLIAPAGLRPMARGIDYGGSDDQRNKYGAFVYAHREDNITHMTQLFLSGELWGIDATTINAQRIERYSGHQQPYLPGKVIEEVFSQTLENYLRFTSDVLHLDAPLKIIAGATDVNGYRISVPPPSGGSASLRGLVHDTHIIFDWVIEDAGMETKQMLLPFFEHLWEKAGVKRPNDM